MLVRTSSTIVLAVVTAALTVLPATATTDAPVPEASSHTSAEMTANSRVRNAVVAAAKNRVGKPYKLEYGWTCRETAMDCECLNRNAVWHGTQNATGRGLQLKYWLQGQINQGRKVSNPRPGDLVFWDTNPRDGIRYGGDLDHTGVYIGNNQVINANAYYGKVVYQSVTLGGTERDPLFVDVLTPNGY